MLDKVREEPTYSLLLTSVILTVSCLLLGVYQQQNPDLQTHSNSPEPQPAATAPIQSEVEMQTSSEKAPAYTWREKELCKSHVGTRSHSSCLWTGHDLCGTAEQRHEDTPNFFSVVRLRKKIMFEVFLR